jgi:phenol hydroxylase P1 protein
MTIDLNTTHIEPLRQSFAHIAAKIGADKPATRYQEAVWGLQPHMNFHYRPTWDPAHLLYDPSRTQIVMRDFDDLIDPRQYYYGTWTTQRARQQDSQERNFEFVEKRQLFSSLSSDWRDKLINFVLPMRHVAWAANANNAYICAYGYGAPITSAAGMQMMDALGIAQSISRIGLVLGDNSTIALDQAKQAWMTEPMWQGARALIETSMVTKDWFELFVLQNFLLDSYIYPLVFERFDARLIATNQPAFSMLSEFMVDWYAEASRWVDAILKLVANESAENRAVLLTWLEQWTPRVHEAFAPLADCVFGGEAAHELATVTAAHTARLARIGLAV